MTMTMTEAEAYWTPEAMKARRSEGAKKAAKTRARHKANEKLFADFTAKFGDEAGQFGEQHDWVTKAMQRSIKTGVLDPRLAARQAEQAAHEAKLDREREIYLARPITPEEVAEYTGMIKNLGLYEGACELKWDKYFETPQAQALSEFDLAYVAQWTACAGPLTKERIKLLSERD